MHRRRRLLYDDEPSRIRELWKDEPEVYALLLQVNLRGLKGGPLARLHAAVVLREAMGDRIDFEVLKRLSPRLSAGVPARVVSTKSLYDGKPRRRRPRRHDSLEVDAHILARLTDEVWCARHSSARRCYAAIQSELEAHGQIQPTSARRRLGGAVDSRVRRLRRWGVV